MKVPGTDVSGIVPATNGTASAGSMNGTHAPTTSGLNAMANAGSGGPGEHPGEVELARPTGLTPVSVTPQVVAPPTRIVVESQLSGPIAFPRSMQWSARQIMQVLLAMGLIVSAGLVAGWLLGGRAEPVYAARSEFIYFLEDAVPDGFLREDRRILTQLVTIESESVVVPIAQEFDMPVKDLREAISVDVVDLSEVIRLDVEDADPDRAVELNAAVLARYRTIAEISDRRADDSVAIDRRTEVIAELEIADKLALDISASQLRDVDLELREESITRQLASAVDRADRLASRADDQLVEVTPVDDRPELQRQLASAREISSSLEGDLLALRSEEVTIERAIEQQVNTEVPFVDPLKEQRLVELRLQADSVQREVDTLAQRIVTLNRLIAESRLDQPAQASSGSIDDELTAANTLVLDLEADLLAVRTERATLGQETATLPSVQRRIDRLEQQLASLDSEIDVAATRAAGPSPIEVLTPPLLLEEPVGNPRLRSAALGFLASLPIALAVGALVRRRQRKQF